MSTQNNRSLWLFLTTFVVVSLWSAWKPLDWAIWGFELLPGAVATAVILWLGFTNRYRFTTVTYLICAMQIIILACGAKYSYEKMPLFDWLRDEFDLSRNYFDRVGHFFQGMSPALVVRELLLTKTNMRRRWLASLLAGSVAVAFSGCYEIIEWLWVVIFYPHEGPQFLGFQGDPWDAQKDILMALLGAIFVGVVLAYWQDRQLRAHDSGI